MNRLISNCLQKSQYLDFVCGCVVLCITLRSMENVLVPIIFSEIRKTRTWHLMLKKVSGNLSVTELSEPDDI